MLVLKSTHNQMVAEAQAAASAAMSEMIGATKEQLARFTGPRQRGEGGRFLKAVEAA